MSAFRCPVVATVPIICVATMLANPDAFVKAGEEVFVSDIARGLWKLDLSTGSLLFVARSERFLDIAMSPENILYGVTGRGELFSIDAKSGGTELVGSLEISDPGGWNSMDFAADGRLFIAQQNLIVAEPATAHSELVGSTGFAASGDLAAAPDGALYMSALNSAGGGDDLIRVDPQTGAGTLIGSIHFENVFGMAYVGDSLFGLTDVGELIRIDITTGSGQLVRDVGLQGSYGMARATPLEPAVPEPGTLMLAFVALTLGWSRELRLCATRSRTFNWTGVTVHKPATGNRLPVSRIRESHVHGVAG